MMHEITVSTTKRNELVDITAKVRDAVSKSGVKEGLCVVYVPHTTAAITVNENADPDVKRDIIAALSRIVPEDAAYSHAEGNSDAHIKSSLVGCSALVPVQGGKPALGTWQCVLLCEFDGPRERKAVVHVLAEAKGGAP